jgi:hypothetical protein
MLSLDPEFLTSKGWTGNFNYEMRLNYYFLKVEYILDTRYGILL